jgi:acyl-CoA thioesterase-1
MRNPYLLAFGDSLTEGYGLARADSFPAQLEKLMRITRPDAVVRNEGLSGDTSSGALARLPRVLSRLQAKPDLAIVEFGANDLIRGIPLPRTVANLDAILTELARCGIAVLLAKMEAPALLGAFGQRCTAIYDDLALRHGVAVHPFFPPGIFASPAYCLGDRIHPNARGIAAVARGFLPAVEAALAASGKSIAA